MHADFPCLHAPHIFITEFICMPLCLHVCSAYYMHTIMCSSLCLCLTMSRLIFLHSIAEFVLKVSIFRRHESEYTCFHIDKLFLLYTLHFIAYITQNIICLFVLLLLFNKFGIGIQTSKIMCAKDLAVKNHQARGGTEPPKNGWKEPPNMVVISHHTCVVD